MSIANPFELAAPASPPQQAQRYRYTVTEYQWLVDRGAFAGRRVELLEGELFEMAAISCPHSTSVGLCAKHLTRAYPDGFHDRQAQPFLVPSGSMPEPDVAIVPGDLRAYEQEHPRQAVVLVEVCISTEDVDRGIKTFVYASAGVPDYWIVFPEDRTVEVYRDPRVDAKSRTGFRYASVRTFDENDRIPLLNARLPDIAVVDVLPRRLPAPNVTA